MLKIGISNDRAPLRALRERGLSLVELLVGLAVGLFIVGGATKLFVDHITDSRRVVIESRVSQDLRAAADLIARDLRRAGYWQNAMSGVVYPAALNPYRVTVTTGGATPNVTYSFSRDATENNAINTTGANENFGFKLENSALLSQTGSNVWNQLTDPNAVVVTSFNIAEDFREVSLGSSCAPVCALGSPGCPSVKVRRYTFTIVGNAPAPNANIVRRIVESVRLRNDELPIANCPL